MMVNGRRVRRVLVFTYPFVVMWPLRIKSRKLFVLDTREVAPTSQHPLSWLQYFYADGVQSINLLSALCSGYACHFRICFQLYQDRLLGCSSATGATTCSQSLLHSSCKATHLLSINSHQPRCVHYLTSRPLPPIANRGPPIPRHQKP